MYDTPAKVARRPLVPGASCTQYAQESVVTDQMSPSKSRDRCWISAQQKRLIKGCKPAISEHTSLIAKLLRAPQVGQRQSQQCSASIACNAMLGTEHCPTSTTLSTNLTSLRPQHPRQHGQWLCACFVGSSRCSGTSQVGSKGRNGTSPLHVPPIGNVPGSMSDTSHVVATGGRMQGGTPAPRSSAAAPGSRPRFHSAPTRHGVPRARACSTRWWHSSQAPLQ
jgi:hypothetical protein